MNFILANKKKLIIYLLIITLIVVGIVTVLILIPDTIEGDWEMVVNPEISQATPDEINDSDRVFYTFSKPDKYGDGTYKTFYDGGVEEGSYKLSEKDDKQLINLGTEDLEYKITGSVLIGTAELVITYPEYNNEETGEVTPAQDYIFHKKKAPQYEKESYDSFQVDDKLLGEWVTNERTLAYYMYELSYKQTVEFLDNGVFTIHYESEDLALDRYMYYAYTANEDKISFSLVTDKETQYTVSYDFDEDGNLIFVEDSTSQSIFADSFFSSFTYYTPDNLQKETTETSSVDE